MNARKFLLDGAFLADADGNPTGWTVVGSVSVDREFETVRTERTPVIPDEGWHTTHTGHEHRWTKTDSPYAILNAERYAKHIECDGSCGGVCGGEGYHVTAYRCVYTGEDLDPDYRPDPRGSERQFLRSETLTIHLTGGPTMPEIPEGWQLRQVIDGETHFMTLATMRAGETVYENDQPPVVQYVGPLHYPEETDVPA